MSAPSATRRLATAASLAALVGAAALVSLAACSDDDTVTPAGPPTTFGATLSGANERPNAVNTPGAGSASVSFTPVSGPATSGTYTVTVTGLTGAPTAAHIHAPADVNTATGVLVNFNPASVTTPAGTFSGTFTQADIRNPAVSVDSVLKLVRAGLAYVNVHTAANGGGEVRGQLTPK